MLLQKQSEELEQNNKELEKLSIIARKTSNAIFILDTFGTIEWVNQGFTKLFGYTLEELEKKGVNTLRMSEDKEMEKKYGYPRKVGQLHGTFKVPCNFVMISSPTLRG